MIFYDKMDMFLKNMVIDSTIVKNLPLKENVFTMIICFLTKTPLFLCGKPGSSKSLSLNLVLDNFQGKSS